MKDTIKNFNAEEKVTVTQLDFDPALVAAAVYKIEKEPKTQEKSERAKTKTPTPKKSSEREK